MPMHRSSSRAPGHGPGSTSGPRTNPAPGVFSLSQQWVAGGSGPSLQTIEGGWHVYPAFHNDPSPITRLFIYWTADGYSSTGNYNLLNQPGQPAFVQTDNTWVWAGLFRPARPAATSTGS